MSQMPNVRIVTLYFNIDTEVAFRNMIWKICVWKLGVDLRLDKFDSRQ